jgi:hypothetical protein
MLFWKGHVVENFFFLQSLCAEMIDGEEAK